MPYTKLRLILSISILFISSIALSKGYQFEAQIDQIIESEGNKQEANYVQKVILLPTKIIIATSNNAEEIIYDFHNLTTTSINHKNKTFTKNSIFALVAFKHFEMQNRQFMFKSMSEIAPEMAKDPSFKEFYLESLFDMKINSSKLADITQNIKDGSYKFIFDKEEVTSFTLSDKIIPDDLKESFAHYLVYNLNIHPDIRNIILLNNAFPASINYKYYPIVKEIKNVSVKLAEIKEYLGNDVFLPKDYKEKYSDKEWLNSLAERIHNGSSKKIEAQYELEMRKLLASGDFLDAYLLSNEQVIQSGALLGIEKDGKILDSLRANEQVAKLRAALDPKSKEETEKSIEITKELAKQNLKHGYVLDIYLGNFCKNLGKYQEAQQYFVAALKKNPFLTGVYIDLGRLFMSAYDMQAAWECFSIARTITPNYPMLEGVASNEVGLKKLYQDHF